MKKLFLSEEAVEMEVQTEFLSNAVQDWRAKRLMNFMPPFLSGSVKFAEGYTFTYKITGVKDVYPKRVLFYGSSASGNEVSGFFVINDQSYGRPKIITKDWNYSSEYEKDLLFHFLKLTLYSFGEYNYQKRNRGVVEKVKVKMPIKSDKAAKTGENETLETKTAEQRKFVLDSKELSKPFIHETSNGIRQAADISFDAKRQHNSHYVLESWPSSGYYRRDGLYVEPCIKHRRKDLLNS
ncbi:MAG: hypothetical protein SO401_09930 [Blautia sp.]|nr:hypothetical protein [Blautia sp.]